MAAFLYLCSFAGRGIFGTQNRQSGPSRPYRAQEEQLPGVDGLRVYRLGKGPQSWTVRGRLTAGSLAGLNSLIRQAQSLIDGNVYTFVDNGGTSHANCMLTDFDTAGPFQRVDLGQTVEIVARVLQINPDN